MNTRIEKLQMYSRSRGCFPTPDFTTHMSGTATREQDGVEIRSPIIRPSRSHIHLGDGTAESFSL